MVNVITFSLYGNGEMYLVGAIENAKLAKKFYPDFECWYYVHKESITEDIIKQIDAFDNTKIILKSGNLLKCKPMAWRFEAIDDPNVEIMMARDLDTRILLREKLAVDQWLKSDKLFHIMRDHKKFHTYKIFGGMFGTKKIPSIKSWKKIIDSVPQKKQKRNYDLRILEKIVKKIPNNKVFVHSTKKKFPGETIHNYPIPYDSYANFIGQHVYADGSTKIEHNIMLRK